MFRLRSGAAVIASPDRSSILKLGRDRVRPIVGEALADDPRQRQARTLAVVDPVGGAGVIAELKFGEVAVKWQSRGLRTHVAS
jgi:hypothetical protein